MAIVKVISHGKTRAATRQVLSYILDFKKTEPELCGTLGDMLPDAITAHEALLEFDDPLVQKSGCVCSVTRVPRLSQAHVLTYRE